MSRRSRRRAEQARYAVERGEPYYRSIPHVVPPFRGSSLDAQSGDLYAQLLELGRSPEAAVYPWRPYLGTLSPGLRSPQSRRSQAGRGYSYSAPPRPSRRAFGFQSLLSIATPSRVAFCVRRTIRRQVLFALGRAGYSGSAPKRHYRRTQNSQWRC